MPIAPSAAWHETERGSATAPPSMSACCDAACDAILEREYLMAFPSWLRHPLAPTFTSTRLKSDRSVPCKRMSPALAGKR